MIGLAAGLTATAISAAIENAASDIDELPEYEADITALVEQRLAARIVEKTGVDHTSDSVIEDSNDVFNFTDDGESALKSAASKVGHPGPILNVRSRFIGVVSSGLRHAGDEIFESVVILQARVFDGKSGAELGKTECQSVLPIGTLATYRTNVKKFADVYRKAIEDSALDTSASVENEDDASTTEASVDAEVKLPPETYEDHVVQSHVKKCEDLMRWQLI